MKTKLLLVRAVLVLLFATLNLPFRSWTQTTVFTYQGRLTSNGALINGSNDLTFTLYDALSGGATVGMSNVINNLAVSNGFFTVTLDFAGAFDGSARWLQIGVRPGASVGAYTNLVPRQPVTAAPYAIRALSAGTAVSAGTASGVAAGAVTSAGLAPGSVGGVAIADGSIAATDLAASLLNTTFWKLGGNAGVTSFIGTTDDRPLELRVNGESALRLESTPNDLSHSNIVNVIGGSSGNSVGPGVYGGIVAGGGAVEFLGESLTNKVTGNFGTVGGGGGNTSHGEYATVGGGYSNTSVGAGATVGGGVANNCRGLYSMVGGGLRNNSIGWWAAASGGADNISSGDYATVPGGFSNAASGQYSFAAGNQARALHNGSFVWADGQSNPFVSTEHNQFLVRAGGGVGINKNNPSTALDVDGVVTASTLHVQGYMTASRMDVQEVVATSSISVHGVVTATNDSSEAFEVRGGAAGYSLFDRISGAAGRWSMFASGGVLGFYSAKAGTTRMFLSTNGLYVDNVLITSDRNAKENFKPISAQEILEKVAALPLSEWNYKQDTATRHLGPMAQDFHAAFGVGPDDKHIATVDADGVALAAIQALNQKVQEQRAENAELKRELIELKRLMNSLARKLDGGAK